MLRLLDQRRLDGRSRPALMLRSAEQALAADLGGSPEALTTAQRLLVREAAVKSVVLGLMASYAFGKGILDRRGRLSSTLGKAYLAWSNALRHDLTTIGLERRAQVIDIAGELARMAREGDGSRPTQKPTHSEKTQPGGNGEGGGAS